MRPESPALIWDARRPVGRVVEFVSGRSWDDYRQVRLRSALTEELLQSAIESVDMVPLVRAAITERWVQHSGKQAYLDLEQCLTPWRRAHHQARPVDARPGVERDDNVVLSWTPSNGSGRYCLSGRELTLTGSNYGST